MHLSKMTISADELTSVYVYMCIYVYICMYMCICLYVYTYIYVYVLHILLTHINETMMADCTIRN